NFRRYLDKNKKLVAEKNQSMEVAVFDRVFETRAINEKMRMIVSPKPMSRLVYTVAPLPWVEAAAAEMMIPTAMRSAAKRATVVSLAMMNFQFPAELFICSDLSQS